TSSTFTRASAQYLQRPAPSSPLSPYPPLVPSNCAAAVTITSTDQPTAASCTGVAGIDRTWKAADGCGNIATGVQHIVFVDTTPPNLKIPAPQPLHWGTSCVASSTGAATSSGNC